MNDESFALLCFLVLMQGIETKSPDYITEKAVMMKLGLDAFPFLDIHNMRKVVRWLEDWKVEVPPKIAEEMRHQNDAEANLRDWGFSL